KLGEEGCSCEVVVDWSEEMKGAGSVDYSEKNPRINFKNPVESGKTGFSEVGKNPSENHG
ncbi:hypothetical protein CROQUDRAFT_662291, partial [Cronartium quercuum f. sp. fusiforme G11]